MQIDLSKQERWIIGLLIAILLLFAVFLTTILRKKGSEDQYKAKVALRDSIIAQKESIISVLQKLNMEKQNIIYELGVKDSLLFHDVIKRIDKLKAYDKEDENITKRIHSSGFTADSIRGAFADY